MKTVPIPGLSTVRRMSAARYSWQVLYVAGRAETGESSAWHEADEGGG
ncbi:hypothetical protein [Nocardia arthritidis]|nr:hypothetical protein [Nocardia arthritidis]